MNLAFYQLAVRAEFVCRGERFRKTAMSFAYQIGGANGSSFHGDTPVISDGPFLAPKEAALWRPDPDWGKWLAMSPLGG